MSEPRVIRTVNQLKALPDMTILVDQHGIAWQKFIDECSDQPYWAMDGTKCYEPVTVLQVHRRELTVIWEPPCPTCSGPIRETVNMRCQTCGRDFMKDDE